MKINKLNKSVLIMVIIEMLASIALAYDDAATYLIMNDIPPYYRLTTTRDIVTDKIKTIPGYVICARMARTGPVL